MAKYKVLRRCHGFRRRLWEAGTVVDIDPSENPPYHFELIKDNEIPQAVKPVVDDKIPLSAMAKPPEVVGGMGSSLPKAVEPVKRQTKKPK
jgi:hypothetical protein